YATRERSLGNRKGCPYIRAYATIAGMGIVSFRSERKLSAMATNPVTTQFAEGIEIKAPITPEFAQILTPEAMNLVAKLARSFETRRQELLQRRVQRQAEIDAGKLPDFLPDTAHIRQPDSTIAPIPADLQDRRVEITGPVDRKMVINALNSGAKVFMADFEDAHSPTWEA